MVWGVFGGGVVMETCLDVRDSLLMIGKGHGKIKCKCGLPIPFQQLRTGTGRPDIMASREAVDRK